MVFLETALDSKLNPLVALGRSGSLGLSGFVNKFNADGKSLYNPPAPRSKAYDEFPDPLDKDNNGFDFHSELWLGYERWWTNSESFFLL